MRITDLISMSIRSLWRRKTRTFLTVLGVVIGSSSIILMLSVGIGMDESFRAQVESMGSLTLIEVYPDYMSDDSSFNQDTIDDLSEIHGVEAVIPIREMRALLQFGKLRTTWSARIHGISPEHMQMLDYVVDEGRNFTASDHEVMCVGTSVLEDFYKIGQEPNWNVPNPPIEPELEVDSIEILLGKYDYERHDPIDKSYETGKKIDFPDEQEALVLGFFDGGYPLSSSVFVPVDYFKELLEIQREYELELQGEEWFEERYGEDADENETFEELYVKVIDEDLVTTVQEEIKDLGYEAYSNMTYLESMQEMSAGIQAFLGGIGGISLFVSAIGITNTMMMATYERTREIGIMKVIGAKINDIQRLFLLEALLIGALGGLCGIIFSFIISFIINNLGASFSLLGGMGGGDSKLSIIPFWLVASSLGFATLVGLVSGYFPARRAMKLSALSAIKND